MDVNEIEQQIEEEERGFFRVASDAQVAWIATIGMTRKSFFGHLALIILLLPFAFWLAYISPAGDWIDKVIATDTEMSPASFLLFMMIRALYWGCVMLPPAALIGLTVFTLSGMFTATFWKRVDQLRASDVSGVKR